jgi:hypothetical protein
MRSCCPTGSRCRLPAQVAAGQPAPPGAALFDIVNRPPPRPLLAWAGPAHPPAWTGNHRQKLQPASAPRLSPPLQPPASAPSAAQPPAHPAAGIDAAAGRHQPADAAAVGRQTASVYAARGEPAGADRLAVAVGVDPRGLGNAWPRRQNEKAAGEQGKQPRAWSTHRGSPRARFRTRHCWPNSRSPQRPPRNMVQAAGDLCQIGNGRRDDCLLPNADCRGARPGGSDPDATRRPACWAARQRCSR